MDMFGDFRRLFVNRKDTYGIQLPSGGYNRISEPLTDKVLDSHLEGRKTVGAYQLNQESMVRSLIFDLDPEHLEDPRRSAEKILASCLNKVKLNKDALLLEASRYPDPSYHIWVFFDSLFPAKAARWIGYRILSQAELNPKQIEVFPKQDELLEERPYGNFVKLPLGLHRVAKKWSRFLDFHSFEPLLNEVIKEVRGITFPDRDIKRIIGLREKQSSQTRNRLPTSFKPLRVEDEERAVQFLCRYWKPGYRNQLEVSFLGWCIKKGINYNSAYKIVEEVTDITSDEEKSSRLRLVEYHYKSRLTVPLRGKSGLREIVEELIQGGK